MQGQRSPVRTLAKNFPSESSSTSNDNTVDCQISWNGLQTCVLNRLPDYQSPSNGGWNAEWCFGESSSAGSHRPGVSDERKLEQAWRASCFQEDLEQNSESGTPPHVADLNMSAEYEDEVEDEEYPCNERPNRNSLEPFSGSHGFVMDESEEKGHGFSLDAQRMPYKRKAIEVRSGPSSGAENDIHLPLTITTEDDSLSMNNETERASSRIRLGVGEAVSGSQHGESSIRSTHLRNNALRLPHPGPDSRFLTEVDVRSGDTSSSSRLLPLRDYLYDSNPVPGFGNRSHSSILQARWNGASSRRTHSSSTEMTSTNIPRSISEHPVFVPGNVIGNSSAENERPGSSSSARYPSSSMTIRTGSRYRQRLSEMMRRPLIPSPGSESGPLSSHHAMEANSSSRDVTIPSVPDNHHRRRVWNSEAILERHLDSAAYGAPYSLRNQAAAAGEGRRNIMTEHIRHVLDLMRRGESLRFMDMMILDHSILSGMAADVHDRHREMRMDVDNMSYEELLALEERIGNVCTGLSEEAIANSLKKRRYRVVMALDEMEKTTGPCCICREEYVAGDEVGEISCGHDFHADCIKQWLRQKNLCPICKTTGLNT